MSFSYVRVYLDKDGLQLRLEKHPRECIIGVMAQNMQTAHANDFSSKCMNEFTRTNIHTQKRTNGQTRANVLTCTHSHSHSFTFTRTRTRTHKHTCTHSH